MTWTGSPPEEVSEAEASGASDCANRFAPGQSPTKVWLGTAGWSYLPDWAGTFYPEGTLAADTLRRYVEAFRFLEIDSTFYATPAASTIERWDRIMPTTFRVSCKAPKELVQDTMLNPPEVPFRLFCESLLDGLGERLAMIVVQMQPSFARTVANDDRMSRALRGGVARPVVERARRPCDVPRARRDDGVQRPARCPRARASAFRHKYYVCISSFDRTS
jgi:uncharacterized protein YecE (DUF72 family)